MRFTTLFAACTVALSATSGTLAASPAAEATFNLNLAGSLTPANNWGAPIPPWQSGCKPGWYYGDHQDLLKIIIPWLKDNLICAILDLLPFGIKCPHKPPPPPPGDGWDVTFQDYNGAIQADGYLTFGLVDTVDDCKAMCDNVDGCTFINTYHDVNGKDGSPLLTCSLYSQCWGQDKATNMGGQSQPDGSINHIEDSAGYCKHQSG
ncbi:hypothetical protein L218DRAFT_916040 [Marasmius fiardii PR-910]|nr:hypothetical protein L218DRAFT_916040 [Marasmius fiardii PR-910]